MQGSILSAGDALLKNATSLPRNMAGPHGKRAKTWIDD